jgi:hypothetical protein
MPSESQLAEWSDQLLTQRALAIKAFAENALPFMPPSVDAMMFTFLFDDGQEVSMAVKREN